MGIVRAAGFGIIATVLCYGSSAAQTAEAPPISLPVRVHLLWSAESDALTTTWSEEEVQQLLATANRVWAQAGIQWVLESIVEEEALNGALFDSLLAGRAPRTGKNQRSVIPRDSLLDEGWNLFLIRDYGRIGGGVFWKEIPGIVLAELGMGLDLAPEGRGGRTLAHELGHSLGLEHEDCRDLPNVMAVACWRPGLSSSLRPDQIKAARTQARTGRPIGQKSSQGIGTAAGQARTSPTADNKRLAPPRPTAAPENPPRPFWSW